MRLSLDNAWQMGVSTKAWATKVAESLIAKGGTGLKTSPLLGDVRERDRQALQRLTSGSVEAFNAELSRKLGVTADKIAARMEEHLDADRFKPGELAFALATVEDKRSRLDGRSALASGSVNVQINNYGANRSRDEILASIEGIELPAEIVKTGHEVV